MISFKQFITEARMAPLYHGTSTGAAQLIIKTNKIEKSSDWLGSIPDGVSLTRNFSVASRFATMSGYGVIFELDQQKLSQRYKIKPVNFFAHGLTDKVVARQMDSSKHAGENEYEERVFATIQDIDKYITKIIVLQKPGHNMEGNLILNHPKLYYKGKFINK